MPDIAHTLVSNSTQLDNVDLLGGARVFTITDAALTGSDDQPLSVTLAEYPRPWKPGLTMRRLLSEMWGSDSDAWAGRRVRLYRDETVSFGKAKTGGTRISHASHLDKAVTVTLPISKGKFGEFKVEPLKESPAPSEPSEADVAASTDADELRAWWKQSSPARRTQIEARVKELSQLPQSSADVDPNAGLFDGDES